MASFSQLSLAFEPSQKTAANSPLPPKKNTSRHLDSYLKKMKRGDEWHNNMCRATAIMVKNGFSDNDIHDVTTPLTQSGYSASDTQNEVQKAVDGARAKGFDNATDLRVPSPFPSLEDKKWPTEYNAFDEKLIPPRVFLYGQHMIQCYVSVIASPGGLGKTSLLIGEGISVATGKPLMGEKVHKSVGVWFINAEDPLEEMQRKVVATMKQFKVSKSEVKGRLFIDAGRDLNMVFATQSNEGAIENSDLVDSLCKGIIEKGVGLVIIDPFVGIHGVNENDNMAINTVVAQVRKVADTTGAAIVLVHHTRKSNGQEIDVDSIRGAGAIVGAARAARVINRMSKQEAEKLGLGEDVARSIFRVDDAKTNLTPPAEHSVWRKMVNVKLLNGDNVGVAVPFCPPDPMEGITPVVLRDVQMALQAHIIARRKSEISADWVGYTVAEVMGLDVGVKIKKKDDRTFAQNSARAKIRWILDKWISEGGLIEDTVPDKRNTRNPKVVLAPRHQDNEN